MFSVVTPTMWKHNELERMLPMLEQHPLVGEVILIDNDIKKTPLFAKTNGNLKIKRFPMPYNVGVNPAWDLGIREASYDKICLLSDDVLIDTSVFDLVANSLSIESGTIGICNQYVNIEPTLIECSKIKFGFGALMFLHKSNYVTIPHEYKIMYGDVWLIQKDRENHRTPKMIFGIPVDVQVASTSTLPEHQPQINKEHELFLQTYGINFREEFFYDWRVSLSVDENQNIVTYSN